MKTLQLSFLQEALANPKLLKQDRDWLTHIKPYLAAVKPRQFNSYGKYDANAYFTNLGSGKITSVEVNGTEVSIEVIKTIWRILAKYTRSEILPASTTQIAYPQYSAAVPIGMAAFRDAYGIKYSSWDFDESSPYTSMFKNMLLGRSLATIYQVGTYLNFIQGINDYYPEYAFTDELYVDDNNTGFSFDPKLYKQEDMEDPLDPKTQKKWRDQITKNGQVGTGEYSKLAKLYPNSHYLGYDNISKFFWCMLTQTWIFEPSVRHPDMITQFNQHDFDSLATPISETIDIFDIWNQSEAKPLPW